MLFQTLAANTLGRDFIIGDLHGCIHLLHEKMDAVRFDTRVDRVISVGDLVDRGPDSLKTLRLIKEPWFKYVPGNHEEMLLTWLGLRASDYHRPSDFLYNGGDWVGYLSSDEIKELRLELAPRLLNAPRVMRVQDSQRPYCVVHAERVAYGPKLPLLTDAELSERIVDEMGTPLTWGRRLIREAASSHATHGALAVLEGVTLTQSPVEPGVCLTYVGHTILRTPVMHRSHVYVDRGAVEQSPESELFMVEHGKLAAELARIGR